MDIQLGPAFIGVDEARKKVEGFRHWSREAQVKDLEFVVVPEVQKSRLGVRFTEDKELVTFPVTDRSGLKKLFGINEKGLTEYYDDEELIQRMLKHCMRKRFDHFVRVCGQQGVASSIRELKGAYVAPLTVFDITVEELGCAQVESVSMWRNDLTIRFIGEYNSHRPKDRGDVSHVGIVVRMDGRLSIGAYCYRMVCRNGMMGFFERLNYSELGEMTGTTIRTVIQGEHARAREMLNNFFSLDEVSAENPVLLLAQLGRQFQLPKRVVSRAQERVVELPESPTQYDIVNLLTLVIRDIKRNEKMMQRVGRVVDGIARESARCRSCGSILPGS